LEIQLPSSSAPWISNWKGLGGKALTVENYFLNCICLGVIISIYETSIVLCSTY